MSRIHLHATSADTFAFDCGGIEITDPLTSSCGRFEYNPRDPATESVPAEYGFSVYGTGGGNTAWRAECMIGTTPVYMLITDDNLSHEVECGMPITVGVYMDDDENEECIACWVQSREADPETGMMPEPKVYPGDNDLYHTMLATATRDPDDVVG